MTSAATALAARTKQNETDIEVLTALLLGPGITSAFDGLPLGTALPLPQELIVKQSGSWVRLAWTDFLTALSGNTASLDFSKASNSQYIGAVHI